MFRFLLLKSSFLFSMGLKMAEVNLSIKDVVDEDDGRELVDIKIESNPPWDNAEDAKYTASQIMGLQVLEILKLLHSNKSKEEILDALGR